MRSAYDVGSLDLKRDVRLLLLHPVSPVDGEDGPFPSTHCSALLPTTLVDEIYCPGAPKEIPNSAARRLAAPFVVAKSRWAEAQGYDAVVVDCMLDPGVREAKRAVSIPVIGIGEATRAIAALVGDHPATIYPRGVSPLKLVADEERTVGGLLESGRWRMRTRDADVLIPNCAYLGGLAQRLEAELGVPVLPNRDIGLRCAELLATFRTLSFPDQADGRRPSRIRRLLFRSGHRVKRLLRHRLPTHSA